MLPTEASENIILKYSNLISDGRLQYLYNYGTNAGDFKMNRRTEVTGYPLSPPVKIGCNTYDRICVSIQSSFSQIDKIGNIGIRGFTT